MHRTGGIPRAMRPVCLPDIARLARRLIFKTVVLNLLCKHRRNHVTERLDKLCPLLQINRTPSYLCTGDVDILILRHAHWLQTDVVEPQLSRSMRKQRNADPPWRGHAKIHLFPLPRKCSCRRRCFALVTGWALHLKSSTSVNLPVCRSSRGRSSLASHPHAGLPGC